MRRSLTFNWARPWKLSRPQRQRIGWLFAASAALHLLLLLLFWPWEQSEPQPEPEPVSPPSVAMVFESGQPKSTTPKQSPRESLPTPPVPPAAPPTAQANPAPPPQGTQAPPTPPTPPAPPAPEAPAEVSLTSPSPPSPELPLPPPVPVPEAPEPLPPPSRQKLATLPNPQPRPRPPSPERPQTRNGFPVPMNFSFGGRTSSPTPLTKAFADYSPGPASRSAESVGEFAKVTKGKVAADWMNELRAWWIEHRFYPDQAAMAGEDGMVQIEITVDRYGKVHMVDLLSRSGSQWLDMGAQSVFRNANLPPLPPDTRDDEITLDLTIDYILVRR